MAGNFRTQPREGLTKLYYEGFEFTRGHVTSVKITYRCSAYRRPCLAKFVFLADTMAYCFDLMVPHTCRAASQISDRAVDDDACVDVREAMKGAVDLLAVDTSDTQQQIWHAVLNEFCSRSGPPIRGLSKNQVFKRVQNTRRNHYGGDLHGCIEVPPLSKVKATVQGFFQFNYTWHDDVKAQKDSRGIDRVVGWSHPELRNLLRFENLTWFIDGTFRCAPPGFAQCITVMVYDVSTELYVPVLFSLTTCRTQDAYKKLLQCIEFSIGRKPMPKEVICDFEAALIFAVRDYFPETRIIGCFFHFKQACRRQLKKYRLSDKEAAVAMSFGVLDMLTVLDPEKIGLQGIEWVKRKIRQQCNEKGLVYSRSKWRQFWRYFRRTWMTTYPPAFWNVFGINRKLVSRTNNPLERFNREMNTRFSVPHPSLTRFVTAIEELAREHVMLRAAVASGNATRPDRQLFRLPRAVVLPNASDIDESTSSNSSQEVANSGTGSFDNTRSHGSGADTDHLDGEEEAEEFEECVDVSFECE